MHNFKNKQLGISLLELLIASALGIVVILGMTRSMTAFTQTSRIQQEQITLQQTADLAFSYYEFRLRNALSTPCSQFNQLKGMRVNNLANGDDINAAASTQINNLITNRGINVQQSVVALTGITVTSGGAAVNTVRTDNISFISATDRLRLDGETGVPVPGTAAAPVTTNLRVNSLFPIDNSDNRKLYVLTDCQYMDVFSATRAETNTATLKRTQLVTTGNTTFSTNYRGSDGAIVSRLAVSTIGLDNNGRLFDRTIYDATLGNTLLDDIELVRVLFGVDAQGNDGIVDSYITASQLSGLAANTKVLTAEIFLLVRAGSTNRTLPANYTLNLPDTSQSLPATGAIPMQTLNITDQIHRKVFTRTIAFRNKVAL